MTDHETPASPDSPGSTPANSAVLDFCGVHRMIRGYITKLDAALAHPRAEAAWGRKLAELVLYGVHGLRFHHHVEDDEYWPALVAHGADGSLLEPLSATHRDLDPALDKAESAARRLAASPTDPEARSAVTDLWGQFSDHVREHLDQEEPIIIPLLEQHISDADAHTIAARVARSAPRKGVSWMMGGVTYAMTPEEAENFLKVFPKPIIWMRPMLLRTYRRNCAALGVDPRFV